MLLEENEGISVNIEEERAFSVNFKKKKIQAPTHIIKKSVFVSGTLGFLFQPRRKQEVVRAKRGFA